MFSLRIYYQRNKNKHLRLEENNMSNRNYRKLNMNELEKVAGGIRVLGESGDFGNADPVDTNKVGIPRGGRVQVRVK